MASVYGTGMSSKPIDFVSGAMAFNQSALENRLKEIETNKETVSENYKNVLKASSIKALPELANELRNKYQGEIEKYRTDIMNKFKESGGKLSMQQQREIQDGYVDMQQKMLSDVNEMKKYDSALAVVHDPRFKDLYDPEKYKQIYTDWYTKKMNGEDAGDLQSQLTKAILPTVTTDFVFKRYGNDIKGLDISSKGRWKDANTFEFTTAQDEAEVDELVDYAFRTEDVLKRRDTPEERQRVKDAMIKSQTEFKPYRASSGGSGGDRYKNTINYTPNEFEYAGKKYNTISIPASEAQTERNFFINKATNLDDGKQVQLTQDNAQIVGIDVDNGVLLLKGKGAYAKRGGEDLFTQEGVPPRKKDGQWIGDTPASLRQRKDDILKGLYEGTSKIKSVEDQSVDIDGDKMIVSGTLVLKNGDKVPVQKTYTKFTDTDAEAVFETDLWKNKTAVSNLLYDVSINNKPLNWYFENMGTKQSDGASENNKGELD